MSLKAPAAPEPQKIYVSYDESTSGGEAEDPNDEWTHHADRVTDLTIYGLHKSKPSKPNASYDGIVILDPEILKLQHVYLVVVRYSDGGTFGRTCGYHMFWSIRATEAEVLADKAMIEAPQDPLDRNFRPWEGYFAGLEDVEIHLLPLLP